MQSPVYQPSGEELRLARERIKPWVNLTPLLRAEGLERTVRRVFVKLESLQRTGSFKVRGAFNVLSVLAPDVRARGAIAYSSGNHGIAVAFAAHEMGKHERKEPYKCTVVMPEGASPIKVARIRTLGAEIVFCGNTVQERQDKAQELAKADGRTIVPSFDDPNIICGQGSLGAEIMDQWMGLPSRTRRLYLVAGPVGGGGLMAGTSASLRARGFGGRIVGIEPEDANDTQLSLAAGERVSIDPPTTICDGLRATTPGALTFPILTKCLEGVVTVTDEEVSRAVRWLLTEMRILVEPSGAAAVAAWMSGMLYEPEHSPDSPEYAGDVVLIVSGGNVDPRMIIAP